LHPLVNLLQYVQKMHSMNNLKKENLNLMWQLPLRLK